jgi:hypothetical protein
MRLIVWLSAVVLTLGAWLLESWITCCVWRWLGWIK